MARTTRSWAEIYGWVVVALSLVALPIFLRSDLLSPELRNQITLQETNRQPRWEIGRRPQARGDRSSRRAGGAVMALSGVRIASDVRRGDDSGASHRKSSSSRRRSDGGAVSDLICRGVGMAER
ncbi:hypothetical protein BT93_L2610 [Corymbia citriodora subsp. variegata]|uniref:Uncharacterized protein n=1 Tax=Corymbia citriodora subsp. variegata TaxID=360336 RepID=A0A8T0CNV6_CORYI|nr:hypothetical protein BT93_L2610 [Corymbia citriodora subsp. variegata]